MSDSLFSKRYFYPVAGGIFCLVMACVPTILELAGLGGGGIAQLDMLNKIGIYAALALSLNLILGQTGLFHMGHTAFFAMGAYTTTILNTVYHWPVFATMPIAGVLAAIFAFVLAKPIIHLRGDYLLIVTIGIVEIVRIALTNNLFGLTGGANGIYGIARPSLFGMVFSSPKRQFYLIWTFTILTMFLFYVLEHSRFGRALNYIRYDDLAASGCGIDVTRYKLMAFTVGAFWAGMVGTLFAANIRTIEPTSSAKSTTSPSVPSDMPGTAICTRPSCATSATRTNSNAWNAPSTNFSTPPSKWAAPFPANTASAPPNRSGWKRKPHVAPSGTRAACARPSTRRACSTPASWLEFKSWMS